MQSSLKGPLSVRMALGIVISLILACSHAPPIKLENQVGGLTVGFQTLGEYPTTVRRFIIADAKGKTVWEVRANRECRKDAPQIWKLSLKEGHNKASIDDSLYGNYDVVVPPDGLSFNLKAGKPYTLGAWGESNSFSNSVTFTIRPAPSKKRVQ